MTRRTLLRSGVVAGIGLSGCSTAEYFASPSDSRTYPEPEYRGYDREYHLTASVGEVAVAPGETIETWLYNGQYPGPELRAREGERVRITVENELPEPTSVHWHGMSLRGANAMDGVPGVTQSPIEPGAEFVYEFDVGPTGTHWYHSHVGLQLDRGLLGPLIVEEASPHVAYDREQTVVLDEYLTSEPAVTSAEGMGMMGGFPAGPAYDGTLLNGKLPTAPETIAVQTGERVRLRFLNAGAATTYRVSVAGHPLEITHADGPAVEPVEVDQFDIGMGERYDALITADSPGTWEIRATPLDGETPAGRALLQYGETTSEARAERSGSRRLAYGDLRAVSPTDRYDGSPDQTIELDLSPGGMMGGDDDEWTIDGQAYPDADPLRVADGDHVRIQLTNHSPMSHPMHLHGHHFLVDGALADTVTVPGQMGQRTLDVIADNPGNWFFHCHHLYHMETGMIRVLEYETA